MLEKDANLVMSSLYSALPYIAHPSELKDFIKKEVESCDCVENFVENFKKKMSEKIDITRKTDGQIFFNELCRTLKINSIGFNPGNEISS